MGPVGRPELRDERLDPLFHGVLGKNHRARDLLVGVALRQVAKELELAGRQRLRTGTGAPGSSPSGSASGSSTASTGGRTSTARVNARASAAPRAVRPSAAARSAAIT